MTLSNGLNYLYQWDTDISAVDADLEEGQEVHIANEHTKSTAIVLADDSHTFIIPDKFMLPGQAVKVWYTVTTTDGRHTIKETIIPVRDRAKPADYVYSPEEVRHWDTLQAEIGDLSQLTTDDKDNLVDAINELDAGKSNVGHGHGISDVYGLQTALDGKSNVGHGHSISDVSDLQSKLDSIDIDLGALDTALDGKSDAGHTHTLSDITDYSPETYRVDMNTDNYGTLSAAVSAGKLLYLEDGLLVYYLTGYGAGPGGVYFFDFSCSSSDMVEMYEYTYDPNTETQEWNQITQPAKVNEPATEGTSGQVLATDGNGGRYWKNDESGGGGGDSNLFIVNFDGGLMEYTADKSVAEIYAAYGAGKVIIGYRAGLYLFMLENCTSSEARWAYFANSSYGSLRKTMLTQTGTDAVVSGTTYHDSTKQDTISDLSTIRSGAALGSTSVQLNGSGGQTVYTNSAVPLSVKNNINGQHKAYLGFATNTDGTVGYIGINNGVAVYLEDDGTTEHSIQTADITDTGGYFTTDTVEGALQEIGATLDGLDAALAALL